MDFFAILFLVIIGILIGGGSVVHYYEKIKDTDTELHEEYEAEKISINASTMVISSKDDNTSEIIPIQKGNEIVIQPYEDGLVVAVYEPSSNCDDDDDYDDYED